MQPIRNSIALLVLTVTSLAFGHEGGLGRLVGEHLSLHYADHAISGHVNGRLVYASPLASEYGIKLVHRADGSDHESVFKKTDGKLTGTVTTAVEGKASRTEVTLTKVATKEGLIEGRLGETTFQVRLSSATMAGHHYVNPKFEVTLPGRTYTFVLEEGQACMGCATKIVYVVLGMLRATGVL